MMVVLMCTVFIIGCLAAIALCILIEYRLRLMYEWQILATSVLITAVYGLLSYRFVIHATFGDVVPLLSVMVAYATGLPVQFIAAWYAMRWIAIDYYTEWELDNILSNYRLGKTIHRYECRSKYEYKEVLAILEDRNATKEEIETIVEYEEC